MIITRTPMRVSLIGGGSDLRSYTQFGLRGLTVTMAIDKYVYITVNKKFDERVKVSYSIIEETDSLLQVVHPLVRKAAEISNFPLPGGIEITSIADVPAGTGLGSSSSFTVGLLNALYWYQKKAIGRYQLADEAIRVEGHGGMQDAVSAALGGLRVTEYLPSGSFISELAESKRAPVLLQNNILLLYTGAARATNKLLERQAQVMNTGSGRDIIRTIAYLAAEFVEAWKDADIRACGDILSTSWGLKRRISPGITNEAIDFAIAQGMEAGAYGGKLLGAGGGGFLCFIAPPAKHIDIIRATGLGVMPFAGVDEGTSVIYPRGDE